MDAAAEHAGDGPLLHQLREVSAVIALSDDDAGAGAPAARGLRARARTTCRCHRHLWTRAVLLLRRSPLSHSYLRAGGCVVVDGRHGLALERTSAGQARRLRLWPCRNLRCLAPGGGCTLSRVPLVCRRQAAQPRMVVELPLGLPPFRTSQTSRQMIAVHHLAPAKPRQHHQLATSSRET